MKKMKNLLKNLPSNTVTYVLVTVLIFASFFIGRLYTEVKLLREGFNSSARTNVAANPTAAQPTQPSAPQVGDVKPVSADDWVRGNRDAKIALIEYSDLECPFCKQFHATAQQIVDNYDGQVMWVFRNFPLVQLHSQAPKEAEAVECAGKLAGNDGFWALTDLIYQTTGSNNTLDMSKLPDLAVQTGLNRNAFETCFNSGDMKAMVDEDYQSGLDAGVTGTPGNVLLNTETGEKQLIPGALPYDQFKQVIDSML